MPSFLLIELSCGSINAGISKFRLTDKIEVDVQVVGTQDDRATPGVYEARDQPTSCRSP